jgi:hypothetical protein
LISSITSGRSLAEPSSAENNAPDSTSGAFLFALIGPNAVIRSLMHEHGTYSNLQRELVYLQMIGMYTNHIFVIVLFPIDNLHSFMYNEAVNV